MKTVTVELKNVNALKLLEGLEDADIIRIVDKHTENKTKLSSSLRGAISKQRAKEIISQTDEMRKEWGSRDI